jgi:hypothetical protein
MDGTRVRTPDPATGRVNAQAVAAAAATHPDWARSRPGTPPTPAGLLRHLAILRGEQLRLHRPRRRPPPPALDLRAGGRPHRPVARGAAGARPLLPAGRAARARGPGPGRVARPARHPPAWRPAAGCHGGLAGRSRNGGGGAAAHHLRFGGRHPGRGRRPAARRVRGHHVQPAAAARRDRTLGRPHPAGARRTYAISLSRRLQ